jgi:alpha-galactosidase
MAPGSPLKIAVLGAGSLSFAPGVLQDALLIHKLHGIELALVDRDEATVFPMADLARRMAEKTRVEAKITAHTHRAPALDGASYVLCAAAEDRHARFAADCRIIETVAPGHLITEFGGVAGIAYSLRQIHLIQDVCADIKHLAAPGAMLLNVSNPLPRVCQAAHDDGVPTVGFCSASVLAYGFIWKILHDETTAYPFEMARSQLDIAVAGLNHLSFVLDCWDHDTGEDLYPLLRNIVASGRTAGQPASAQILRDTGYFPAPGDERIRDFLDADVAQSIPPRAVIDPANDKPHQNRLKLLKAAAEGKASWDELLAGRSWERPIDLIAARSFGRPTAAFTSLNLINTGQLPQLPEDVFVETPATVDRAGVRPAALEFTLPDSILPLLRRAAQLNDTIVRAVRWSSQELLDEAVELDPTILDKSAGRQALDECLKAHADLVPAYV